MLVFRLNARGIQVGRHRADTNDQQSLGLIKPSKDVRYRIPPGLRAACDAEELASLESWLADLNALQSRTEQLRESVDVLTLPEELARAERWFATTDHPQAGFLALRITAAMQDLEALMDQLAPPTDDAVPPMANGSPRMIEEPAIRGRIDQVLPRRITGWVIQSNRDEPTQIRLLINDKRELSVIADQPRPDIRERGLHPTGHCGFQIQLAADEALSPGDRVRAFVAPDGIELTNSPANCQTPSIKSDP
jgi:hypothetical protein